jgi:hypothetical protein
MESMPNLRGPREWRASRRAVYGHASMHADGVGRAPEQLKGLEKLEVCRGQLVEKELVRQPDAFGVQPVTGGAGRRAQQGAASAEELPIVANASFRSASCGSRSRGGPSASTPRDCRAEKLFRAEGSRSAASRSRTDLESGPRSM